jgi:hypothetical protein
MRYYEGTLLEHDKATQMSQNLPLITFPSVSFRTLNSENKLPHTITRFLPIEYFWNASFIPYNVLDLFDKNERTSLKN